MFAAFWSCVGAISSLGHTSPFYKSQTKTKKHPPKMQTWMVSMANSGKMPGQDSEATHQHIHSSIKPIPSMVDYRQYLDLMMKALCMLALRNRFLFQLAISRFTWVYLSIPDYNYSLGPLGLDHVMSLAFLFLAIFLLHLASNLHQNWTQHLL